MADYVYAHLKASRLVSKSMVWEDDFIAGSDHRLVSCDTEFWNTPALMTRQSPSSSVLPNPVYGIQRRDFKNPNLHTKVESEFRRGCKDVKASIVADLGPLLCSGYAIKLGKSKVG